MKDTASKSGPGLALVFEGGGAKGVAYMGALRAIEARKLRIAAVAGASAGAITAVLVACGYGAARLETEMLTSLEKLAAQLPPRLKEGRRPGLAWWRAVREVVRALRHLGAALENTALRTWLADLLLER